MKIGEALSETSKTKIADRINLAKENSWSQRADAIYEKLGDK